VRDNGWLTIRIWEQQTVPTVTAAIADARQAVENRGISATDGTDMLRSLQVLLSKLDILQKIVESASKVLLNDLLNTNLSLIFTLVQIHPYIALVWQVTSSLYKVILQELVHIGLSLNIRLRL